MRVPVAGTEAAIRGDGWQASLPLGTPDDRLLSDMYPIRGCKDFEKLPTQRVVRFVSYSTFGNCGHFALHGSFMLCAIFLGHSAVMSSIPPINQATYLRRR